MPTSITPSLWFDGNLKDAVDFYTSVFPDSAIKEISYYPTEGLLESQKDMAGKVLAAEFELAGHAFSGINAGPEFHFNEAISFVISCKDQSEIDYYWGKLSTVPEAEQCGWCKDQFGLSWQIVPENLSELLARPDGFQHMLQMKKLIIAEF